MPSTLVAVYGFMIIAAIVTDDLRGHLRPGGGAACNQETAILWYQYKSERYNNRSAVYHRFRGQPLRTD